MTTVDLCKSELDKYMTLMTGQCGEIALEAGEDEDLFRERYVIDVEAGKGSIRANRPRALLLGVYDFLRRCGCRFLRPGKNGEAIPKKKLSEIDVAADMVPANRHRGITIEGAVSLENVLETVEWAPKAGFNSYFLQFRTAFEFFDRWYRHLGNDTLAEEPFGEADSERFVEEIVKKIKERDMLYHAVGHGWTAACVGINSNGWKGVDLTLSPDRREMLALVKGRRGFFENIPLNTNLCYSRSQVRQKMTDEIVAYAEAHPEIDVLHFWLADAFNNVCECENCQKKRFSDWYVMMLNDLDKKLTKKGLKMKICFLVYLDLYWAPETEKILNQDRFIMMFAPIFRSYTRSYAEDGAAAPLVYRLNAVEYPHNAGAYLGLLQGWKKVFGGDAFDFDYHLMWDVNRDFGGEKLAEVLYKDVRSLPALGLNGFMSCQIQRAFYPNGLAFYLLGRALTDGGAEFGALKKEYYAAAFGPYADFAEEFYGRIERDVSFAYMKEETDGQTAPPGFKRAREYLEEVLNDWPAVSDGGVTEESMALTRFVAGNVLRLVEVLILKIEGGDEEALKAADKERKAFFNRGEPRFQRYADGFYVNMIVDGLVAATKTEIYVKS